MVKGKTVVIKAREQEMQVRLKALQIIHDQAISQNLLEIVTEQHGRVALKTAHPHHVQVIRDHPINLHHQDQVTLDHLINPLHQDQVTQVHRINHHHLDLPTADLLQVLHPEVHLQKVVQGAIVRHEAVVEEDN